MTSCAIAADHLFNGDNLLNEVVMTIADGGIQSIVSKEQFHDHIDLHYHLVCPAFVEFQIYGAAGMLFSAQESIETKVLALHKLFHHCQATGSCLYVITIATNTLEVMRSSIDAIRQYWGEGGKGCFGIHLEGPWINVEKRGAHSLHEIHKPTSAEVTELLEYGKDVIKIITLAPEMCDTSILEVIHSAGIIISAGHSNATYDEAKHAFDQGYISTVTHLFNAMSSLNHRAPGLVGATLDHSTIRASIVPDGLHVDYAAVRIAKACMGERLFAITDMVAESSQGPYQHHLTERNTFEMDGGVLSGSAISMPQALHNLVTCANIPLGEALRMTSLYPAQVLGISNTFGRIVEGSTAHVAMLDKEFTCVGIISSWHWNITSKRSCGIL